MPHTPETVPALGAADAAAPAEVPTAFWVGYQGSDKRVPRAGLAAGGSVQDLVIAAPGSSPSQPDCWVRPSRRW
ncbi:hypothetical protein SBI_06424 [Streptomyces bingchenggensis BCW-1]|uniref:Uncharacterized protein n=1 Tax=Streptomyces bingchenggensis (strain BCW-1) TaxID=749414 RepID=D7BTX5_STRBB|nr:MULTISPECIES: hypothetical protein [Streptomyces]ADI09544.1 hypothetical protein SBI_06424 [Streptomyces bingchenggensis BCW-1]